MTADLTLQLLPVYSDVCIFLPALFLPHTLTLTLEYPDVAPAWPSLGIASAPSQAWQLSTVGISNWSKHSPLVPTVGTQVI